MLSIEVIKNFKLFIEIEESVLVQLTKLFYVKSFKRLEYVIRKGDNSKELLFLIRGELQILDLAMSGHEVGIAFVKENDFFGELSVIDGLPRSASVLAMQPSIVAYLPRHVAQQFLFKHPIGSERVLKRLTHSIRSTNQVRTMIATSNSIERVINVLASIGVKKADGTIWIERLPTQNQLATMANLARETVARALAQLKKEGALQQTGVPKQITIKFNRQPNDPLSKPVINNSAATFQKNDELD